jgi:hypothetical protein
MVRLTFASDGQRLLGAGGPAVVCWDGTPLAAIKRR